MSRRTQIFDLSLQKLKIFVKTQIFDLSLQTPEVLVKTQISKRFELAKIENFCQDTNLKEI